MGRERASQRKSTTRRPSLNLSVELEEEELSPDMAPRKRALPVSASEPPKVKTCEKLPLKLARNWEVVLWVEEWEAEVVS